MNNKPSKQSLIVEITKRALSAIDSITADRTAGKITYQAIGDTIGISSSNINRMRNLSGNFITVEACAKLCDNYKISPEWLLLNVGPMKSDTLDNTDEGIADRVKNLESKYVQLEKSISALQTKPGKKSTKSV
jgi:DNA-binding Xre family transcriptional regulator